MITILRSEKNQHLFDYLRRRADEKRREHEAIRKLAMTNWNIATSGKKVEIMISNEGMGWSADFEGF